MSAAAGGGVRALALAVALLGLLAGTGARADAIRDLWQATYWGEPSAELLARFGDAATVLPRPLDFGDSYSRIVLRRVMLGGTRLIAFFQMDKQSGGLKRIQLERPRHGVGPAAFRAVAASLEAEYGPPDQRCLFRPTAADGYQASAELIWLRPDMHLRAVFRDTTIEAFEGCPFGPGITGPCGLTGQLFIRIGPPRSAAGCLATPR